MKRRTLLIISSAALGAVVLAVVLVLTLRPEPVRHDCLGWVEAEGYSEDDYAAAACIFMDDAESPMTKDEFESRLGGVNDDLDDVVDELGDL